MKTVRFVNLAALILLLLSGYTFAQEIGDYRSVANGVWSAASTWETFDGANWVPAVGAPTGAETITVDGEDTVYVDVAVTVTGYVMVTDTAFYRNTAYHTERDTADRLDYDKMAQVVDGVYTYVKHLANN